MSFRKCLWKSYEVVFTIKNVDQGYLKWRFLKPRPLDEIPIKEFLDHKGEQWDPKKVIREYEEIQELEKGLSARSNEDEDEEEENEEKRGERREEEEEIETTDVTE